MYMSKFFKYLFYVQLSANDNVHMARFRDYLDRRGAALSKLPSFTLFCALPYVPDPVSHPSYKHLFTVSCIF